MLIKKSTIIAAVALVLPAVQPLGAQTASDSARLEKLEQAVDQLQKRNAELESEVKSLKKQTASETQPAAPGKTKTQITWDRKTYVEKTVAAEEKPKVYAEARGSEIKLTVGGFIQVNFEDGDVSAFEGRFGQTALKDRFRLRRARINLTGEFAEQFDFKIEGDFEQSDAAITALKSVDLTTGKTTTVSNSTRTELSGTDIFINWHGIPEANIKLGQWKAPFGLEQITPDTKLFMIERSLPTGALTPERQVGVQLWGKPLTHLWPYEEDLVTYYAGIFNGNGRN